MYMQFKGKEVNNCDHSQFTLPSGFQVLQCARCLKHSSRDSCQLSQVFPAEPLKAMHDSPTGQKSPIEELLFEWHNMKRNSACPIELVSFPTPSISLLPPPPPPQTYPRTQTRCLSGTK